MNDQEKQEQTSASAEAAQAVWATYDDELKAAILAQDPVAERLYASEAFVEQLRRQKEGASHD
jgi:hypothetical protein